MNISSVYSYANVFQSENDDKKRNRDKMSLGAGAGDRNTGPDTVSFSSEALEKYLAMKNDSGSAGTGQDQQDAQSSTASDLLGKSHESSKKNKRMSQAELLAFMKSDTFAEEAMGYAKAVTAEGAGGEDGEKSVADQLIKDIGAKKQTDAADGASDSSNAPSVEEQAKSKSGVAFVNGKLTDEKELAAEIHRIEEEVHELTATYDQIMGGEGLMEEKFRISQPVHKRLDERLKELQALKDQAQGLADQKRMMQTT